MLTICFGNRWNIRIAPIRNVTNSSKPADGINIAVIGLPRGTQPMNRVVDELR